MRLQSENLTALASCVEPAWSRAAVTGSSVGAARRGLRGPGLTAARRALTRISSRYRVVIYTDGSGATVARQVDVRDSGDWQARQSFLYTSAMQSADFGTLQSVLYAQVFQVGRTDVSRPAAA